MVFWISLRSLLDRRRMRFDVWAGQESGCLKSRKGDGHWGSGLFFKRALASFFALLLQLEGDDVTPTFIPTTAVDQVP